MDFDVPFPGLQKRSVSIRFRSESIRFRFYSILFIIINHFSLSPSSGLQKRSVFIRFRSESIHFRFYSLLFITINVRKFHFIRFLFLMPIGKNQFYSLPNLIRFLFEALTIVRLKVPSLSKLSTTQVF